MSSSRNIRVVDGYVDYGDTVYAVIPGEEELLVTEVSRIPGGPFDGYMASLGDAIFFKPKDLEMLVFRDRRRAEMEFKLGSRHHWGSPDE
jgi:hypothetical protein